MLRTGVIEGLVVGAPDDFVHTLVIGRRQALEVFSLGIRHIQETADDESQFLAVGRDVARRRILFLERPANCRIRGGYDNLGNHVLSAGGIEQVDLIIEQIRDLRAVPGNARILDGTAEAGQLHRLAARDIAHDVGFLVQFIGHVIQVAGRIDHRPGILAFVIRQRGVLLLFGVPRLDVRVVVADIAFARREVDAFGRLVEIERAVFRILDQIDHGREIAVKQQLRRAAGHRDAIGRAPRAGTLRFKIEGFGIRRPGYREVVGFVIGQLDGLPAPDRNDEDIQIAVDIGREGQPLAVRRHERMVLFPLHGDKAQGLSAGGRDRIDVTQV